MRRRFFVEQFDGDRAVMEGEAAHHLGRVLRAEQGQLYELSDGNRVWLARVEEVTREGIGFSLVEELPVGRPAFQATLLLSVVKFDAFEFALEKATELGVNTIVPLAAGRSEKALLAAAPKRSQRWKKILLEASQQSRRLRIPELKPPTKPDAAFSALSESLKILLSERPEAPTLRTVLEGHSGPDRTTVAERANQAIGDPEGRSAAGGKAAVALAIGPEGGWTDGEFECAGKHGFCEASLGKLILRTETAVIAALASLNYALSSREREYG
jgi:16S rRNA (uracil1498-N3)-methyltransferase